MVNVMLCPHVIILIIVHACAFTVLHCKCDVWKCLLLFAGHLRMNEQESGVVSFDEYVRQKARTVPQHRMKEFLESLAKGPEVLQEFSQQGGAVATTTAMVYQQQGTNCIYTDSTEVAGSLLELACPVRASPCLSLIPFLFPLFLFSGEMILMVLLNVRQSAVLHIYVLWQVQVTSSDISPHMSVHQESEQQLQVQVSLYSG